MHSNFVPVLLFFALFRISYPTVPHQPLPVPSLAGDADGEGSATSVGSIVALLPKHLRRPTLQLQQQQLPVGRAELAGGTCASSASTGGAGSSTIVDCVAPDPFPFDGRGELIVQ
jgi:hypothetical protein